ncbi:MAG TPA: hypothetical protein VJ767_11435 [Nitrososphaeraceae archaeon]|nr:hypothetical protein [Nitrososphaeraceae archaeon]
MNSRQTMNYSINYNTLGAKLGIFSVLTVSLLIFSPESALAVTESNLDNENEEKDNSITTLTTIRAKLNINNIADIENHDRIKVVGYLNGEGQISYIENLKETRKKTQQQQLSNQNLNVDLKFNKSNHISSVMFDDEYFVRAYIVDNKPGDKTYLPTYDCDEGNIGLSTEKDTVKLFFTMKKYNESNTFYKTKTKLNSVDNQIPEKIKITINVPVYDAKDIDDMNVVAMVKGEYQIRTIDVQDELNKEGNNKNGRISVPFIFDRQTEAGPIQPGDMFFGCATSDEFPNQNSDCEKRILKNLNGFNTICARKDNSC